MISLGWTTVGKLSEANSLAGLLVSEKLAACVQVDGPITSHYLWEGKQEAVEEFRLLVKFLPDKALALEKRLISAHPYDTPEWIVISANYVSEKYLSWARQTSTSDPL